MRGPIERNAAADHVRISAKAFLPKILRHDGDVGALLLLRQKVASQNRAHAEHIKIARGHTPAEDLHRVPETREREEKEILPRETVKQRLAIAKMLITRRRHPDVDEITRFITLEQMDNSRGFFKRKPAQKQIVN